MLNKRLLALIILDKKKLDKKVEDSCIIQCIPSVITLDSEEKQKLKDMIDYAKAKGITFITIGDIEKAT